MSEVIQLENIHKKFGKRKILQGISLSVSKGECFSLMGRNGAGKTTLVNMMMGMLQPDQGEVRIFGDNPLKLTNGFIPGVSFVSEKRGVFPWLTVGQALDLAKKLKPEWDDQEEAKLVRHLKLDKNTKCRHMSKGEQGKLQLIIALATKPEVLIMDEPTSGLDPYVRRLLFEGIISIMLDAGKTIFYVTHELHEAQRIAQNVAFIKNGTIFMSGRQDDLRKKHRLVEAKFDSDDLPALPGILNIRKYSDRVYMDIPDWDEGIPAMLTSKGFERIEVFNAGLEDIFCMHLGDEEVA